MGRVLKAGLPRGQSPVEWRGLGPCRFLNPSCGYRQLASPPRKMRQMLSVLPPSLGDYEIGYNSEWESWRLREDGSPALLMVTETTLLPLQGAAGCPCFVNEIKGGSKEDSFSLQSQGLVQALSPSQIPRLRGSPRPDQTPRFTRQLEGGASSQGLSTRRSEFRS